MSGSFRQKLLAREHVFGAWVQIGHPAVAEVFAGAGFDWICVDLEHGIIDLESMASVFRAVSGSGCEALARLPANDPVWIRRALDAGAGGLIIPMVNTAEEAERAVSAASYPPRGNRGFGFCRANLHGREFDAYVKRANADIALIMQIEHADAIENLDAILEVDGVDGVIIGPYDLSGSMGIPGELDHPDMQAALKIFLGSCERHKVSAGIHLVKPSERAISEVISGGYTLVALGIDAVMLDRLSSDYVSMARGFMG